MKSAIRKIICLFLKIIIPIANIFPSSKKNHDYKKYENSLRKLYEPNEYNYKQIENPRIDESIDLSIIIPIYNSEKYIEECIDSILSNKTNYKYEIICINDGSTDSTLEKLKKYKDIIIITQNNKGAAAARNTGLNHAKGKYISFIDSDDYISENFIEKMLQLAYYENCDLVKCGFYRKYNDKLVPNIGIEFQSNDGFKTQIHNVRRICLDECNKKEYNV